MIRKTINYSFREYDSRITSDVVKRAYFGSKREHEVTMPVLKNQLVEILGWVTEHMVLPTLEANVVRDWAFEQNKKYPTRSTIPQAWMAQVYNSKETYTNQKTGYTKHTSPSNIGVLGGMVRNLITQRELTQPQLVALNMLFESMCSDPVLEYVFPSHWIAYDFQPGGVVDTTTNLEAIFGI